MSSHKHMRKCSSKRPKLHKIFSIIKAIYEVTEIVKTIVNFFH